MAVMCMFPLRLVKWGCFLVLFLFRVTATTSGSTMTIPASASSDYASNNTYEDSGGVQLGQQPLSTNSKNIIGDITVGDEKLLARDLMLSLDSRISTLRSRGRSLLSAKEYAQAVDCYAVVLQLVQGCGGEESEELRRRCSLTLAECHLQIGNFQDAISRCSDVIEEAPEVMDTFGTVVLQDGNTVKKIKLALAKAYYRRALALNRLGKSYFALADLEKALQIAPSDAKVLRSMDLIKQQKIIDSNSDAETSLEEFNIESFRDYIEESQSSCSLKSYSEGQVKAIMAGRPLSASRNSRPPAPSDNKRMANVGAVDNNLLGSLLGSGGKGGDMLSSLGGLGGLGSLVGMAGGSAKMDVVAMIDGVTKFTPMLKTIGLANGMDAGLVSQCTEIFKALAETLKQFYKGYSFLKANVNQVVFILTGLWIFVGIGDWINRK